jgi:hypothetical protein
MQNRGRAVPAGQSAIYQIKALGTLAGDWSDWFTGLTVTCEGADPPVVTLSGYIVDQPALRGILNRLWNLNLILISVTRLPRPATEGALADDFRPNG